MKYYFAPMEGITGYVYRNIHNMLFPGIDKYFSPFVVANQTYNFKNKEKKDISPDNNKNIKLIPQILANKSEEFLWACREIAALGYKEINLNLGCPAATVVTKKKGSGFLAYPEELDSFLDSIFYGIRDDDIEISIKTRVGKDSYEEVSELIDIYNKYPIKELIVHPRIQKDFYKGKPRIDIFSYVFSKSKNPVCYNGDIYNTEDFKNITDNFPDIKSVMIGRGLLSNPGLVRQLKTGVDITHEEFLNFHDKIYNSYLENYMGNDTAIRRMKELWFYMASLFPNEEKIIKKIKKSKNITEYENAVRNLIK